MEVGYANNNDSIDRYSSCWMRLASILGRRLERRAQLAFAGRWNRQRKRDCIRHARADVDCQF
jgi:hypothetical protein